MRSSQHQNTARPITAVSSVACACETAGRVRARRVRVAVVHTFHALVDVVAARPIPAVSRLTCTDYGSARAVTGRVRITRVDSTRRHRGVRSAVPSGFASIPNEGIGARRAAAAVCGRAVCGRAVCGQAVCGRAVCGRAVCGRAVGAGRTVAAVPRRGVGRAIARGGIARNRSRISPRTIAANDESRGDREEHEYSLVLHASHSLRHQRCATTRDSPSRS
jgi:hypothetical protein